ncbi:MAG: hypothetical protein ACTHK5_03960 [Tsuneonella sp.]
MERRGEQIVQNETEATGASKEGVVRWVLTIGLLLAIVLLSIIWISGALTNGDVESEENVSEKIAVQKDDAGVTDSSTAPTFGAESGASAARASGSPGAQ